MKKTGIAIKYKGLSDYERYCQELDKICT